MAKLPVALITLWLNVEFTRINPIKIAENAAAAKAKAILKNINCDSEGHGK